MTCLTWHCIWDRWDIINGLIHFHTTSLRNLLNIRWQNRIPDTDILAKANLPSIYTMPQRCHARWPGHACRMSDECILKQLLYGEFKRDEICGRPKEAKQKLKTSFNNLNSDPVNEEETALNRPKMRTIVSSRARSAENKRRGLQRDAPTP